MRSDNRSPLLLDILLHRVLPAILLGSLCLFVLWPLVCLFIRSLSDGQGGVTLVHYGRVWRQSGGSLRNSLFSGGLTAVLCTALSVATALSLTAARGWVKNMLSVLLLVAMVAPPFVSSLAYIQLYGRRGWITYRLLGLSHNPYHCWGVVWMQALSFVPLNAVFLRETLQRLDLGVLRAARDVGARPAFVLRDVVLPLLRPAIAAVALLSFLRSVADFGTPAIIGGRFQTLASDIYLQLIGYGDPEKAAAMNLFLLAPSVPVFCLYRRLLKQTDRLASPRQERQAPPDLALRKCGAVGWLILLISGLFFTMTALQYLSVFLSGFLKVSGGTAALTLQQVRQLTRYDVAPLGRSLLYGLTVALAGTLFAALFAFYLERQATSGRHFWDWVASLPYMLPGTCFGIGYLLAFGRPPLRLTGTAFLIMANMLFRQLPAATRMCAAALSHIPKSQELAVRDMGGSQWSVLWDVILPGLKPAFVSGFVYNFSSCMTTAGAVLFLVDPAKKLAVFRLFDAVYTGEYALASLLATVMILTVLTVEGLVWLAARKRRQRRVS